jgi:type I restriction enzyme S subunit
MNDELPLGWERTTLGGICSKPQYGWTCKASKKGHIKYLRTTDISCRKIDWTTVPFCDEVPDELEKYRVRPNDILVARAGSVGVSIRVKDVPREAVFASYLIRFKALNGIEPKFVEAFLKSECYWAAISEFTAGIAIPNVNATKLASLVIPIAPLPEQRRIVAKLDELFGKVESCQKRLDKIPALLKRFRQAVLAAACSGRLTADWREENPSASEKAPHSDDADLPEIPGGWRWVKLPETGEMTRGRSRHRPRNEPSLFGGPYPFIQTGDIAQSCGRITTHKQIYSEAGLAQSRLWPAGTICITIAANIAESAILTYPACFPDSVVGIIANPKVSVAEYVEFFIRVAKADLATFAPATAQKNINIGILNEVQVPLPPLPEQQEIVRQVDSLFALADQIEARLAIAQSQVDALTPSLLARTFRGELVPQDPSDEPASVFLERIKTARSQKPSKKTIRKKVGR